MRFAPGERSILSGGSNLTNEDGNAEMKRMIRRRLEVGHLSALRESRYKLSAWVLTSSAG
jgi:hypothetical protein